MDSVFELTFKMQDIFNEKNTILNVVCNKYIRKRLVFQKALKSKLAGIESKKRWHVFIIIKML